MLLHAFLKGFCWKLATLIVFLGGWNGLICVYIDFLMRELASQKEISPQEQSFNTDNCVCRRVNALSEWLVREEELSLTGGLASASLSAFIRDGL